MRNERIKKSRGGMGLVTALTLLLVILRLTGRIDWRWLWVLSPLWITALVSLLAIAFILIGGRIKKGKW